MPEVVDKPPILIERSFVIRARGKERLALQRGHRDHVEHGCTIVLVGITVVHSFVNKPFVTEYPVE